MMHGQKKNIKIRMVECRHCSKRSLLTSANDRRIQFTATQTKIIKKAVYYL